MSEVKLKDLIVSLKLRRQGITNDLEAAYKKYPALMRKENQYTYIDFLSGMLSEISLTIDKIEELSND